MRNRRHPFVSPKSIVAIVTRVLAICASLALITTSLRAQAGGVPIFDDDKILASLTQQSARLQGEGKLLAIEKLTAQRAERPKCRLELKAPAHEKLTPAQVCTLAQRSTWIVGIVFHCEECHDWHFSGATGYAIAADGAIATCAHVIVHDPDSSDEFVVAADPDGIVHPVLEVLAADLHNDTCILRVDAKDIAALALNTESHPGDTVFCYGHPQHHFGFFSAGEIARFANEAATPPDDGDDAKPAADAPKSGGTGTKETSPPEKPAAKPAADAPAVGVPALAVPSVVVMEITAEFAAGSSGSPVLDEFGNVVGHAAATEAVFWDDADPSAANHQMTLRIATVARDVLALVEKK